MHVGSRARTRVSTLIREAHSYLPKEALLELEGIAQALEDPLRIAVVGRVNAGKSTLVNALLGRRVAPTAGTECTRLVTHYRYATGQFQAAVVLRDGAQIELGGFHGDRLPENLPTGIDEQQVARLEVGLPSAALKHRVVIDTPGLETVTTELDEATRDAILGRLSSSGSPGSAPTADVIVFVFKDIHRADEREFIRRFVASTNRAASAINAIGVLSHADSHGSGAAGDDDPIEAARDTAQRISDDHRGDLSTVVPLSGLLAETTRCGRLREDDRRCLAALTSVNRTVLAHWHPEEGTQVLGGEAAELESEQIGRLFRLLAPYGVEVARDVADEGLAAIQRLLLGRSGIATLEEVLQERFQLRADVLKANHALSALERLGEDRHTGTAGERLLEDLEDLRLHPELHVLRELDALDDLARDGFRDGEVHQALEDLIGDEPAHAILDVAPDRVELDGPQLARQRATTALQWANSARHPTVANAARVASRSFYLLAQQLESTDAGNLEPS